MSDPLDDMKHDLQQSAFQGICYLAGVGAGGTVGALASTFAGGPAVVLGVVVGLLYARVVCKPAGEKLETLRHTTRFISESELREFRQAISRHVPISREEALALASLAHQSSASPRPIGDLVTFRKDLGTLVEAFRNV